MATRNQQPQALDFYHSDTYYNAYSCKKKGVIDRQSWCYSVVNCCPIQYIIQLFVSFPAEIEMENIKYVID